MKGIACAIFGLVLCGCARQGPARNDREAAKAMDAPQPANAAGPLAIAQNPAAPQINIVSPRRIKYSADIRLITDDFAKAKSQLLDLIRNHKGTFAKRSDISESPGAPKVGTWELRVPAAEFQDFCEEVVKIAEIEKNSTDSEDVTEAYTDLESSIKNRKIFLEKLTRLLMDKADDKNIISINDRINEVQFAIDKDQGRLNVLANLTDLATVNVIIHERKKLVPTPVPAPAEKADFSFRAGQTFDGSWQALLAVGEVILLFLIVAAPWLPIVAVLAAAGWLIWRRRPRPKTEEVPVRVVGHQ